MFFSGKIQMPIAVYIFISIMNPLKVRKNSQQKVFYSLKKKSKT